MQDDHRAGAWSRRRLIATLSAAGLGSAVFGRALLALAAGKPRLTADMIRRAEWIAGLRLTDEKRRLLLESLGETLAEIETLRAVPLDNAVPPALLFSPGLLPGPEGGTLPGATAAAPPPTAPEAGPGAWAPRPVPASAGPASGEDDLAFSSVTRLAALLRAGEISSVELTRLYLDRLRRFDPVLSCVITMTGELALEQAARADGERAAGRSRGPLHGIPWGAKDLLAVPGYPTSWGAGPFRDQVRPETATVAARLEEAGAVLLAKLTVGELAWGDVWYGGTTKNPWNLEQGSSGSSAGSAAATAAGLVGFAIGTETWGSIVSPCTRCGATGLRPTFGRVSRHGAMALAWSMDKIGPIARSAEDCALVFSAIHGADGLDPSARDLPFHWPPRRDLRRLRVGYAASLFEEDYAANAGEEAGEAEKDRLRQWQRNDLAVLDVLREIGVRLRPVALPASPPVAPLSLILTAEAATAFDELTRSGRDAELVRQIALAWPNVFRLGQFLPAVEYLRANRIRTLLMRAMEELFADLDALVAPSFGGDLLLATNLTGHPALVLPDGFTPAGTPTSITFTGRLWGEEEILALGQAFQEATGFHERRPPLAPPDSAPPSAA